MKKQKNNNQKTNRRIFFIVTIMLTIGIAGFFSYSYYKNQTNREITQKMIDTFSMIEKLPTLQEENLDNQINQWQKTKAQAVKAIIDIKRMSITNVMVADELKEEIVSYYDTQLSDHLNELKTLAFLVRIKKDLILPATNSQEDTVREMGALQSRIENLMMSGTFTLSPDFNDQSQKARQEFENYYKSVQENYEKVKKGKTVSLDPSKLNQAIDDLSNNIKRSLADYIERQDELSRKVESSKNKKFF
ncbi:hypothetical protein A2V71_00990 [Candidatus Berkelbacteria bacterium RBG_13_40_8]|uniref:Uncharacterized protein n=1 Tax=Candidatus Berkelbacteria bacterium RBG_13_40_8 TaxID=1797467 RepID=A0A1F5DNU0_9BACT|nr:MAG: hypothetical protein A2V71_00990 [Candidatus Berkelbacteria bacterium RBG_13_40_8]